MKVETLFIGLDADDDVVRAYEADAWQGGRVPMALSLGCCGYYKLGEATYFVLRNNYQILAIYEDIIGEPLHCLEDCEWPAAFTEEP